MPRPKLPPLDLKTLAANQRFPTEAKLQSAMMKSLKDLGFGLRYHAFRTHRLDTAGFLDITAINSAAGLLWTAELKAPTGKASDDQLDWIAAWRKVRRVHTAGVLFPVDYDRALDDLRRLLGQR